MNNIKLISKILLVMLSLMLLETGCSVIEHPPNSYNYTTTERNSFPTGTNRI